MKYVQKLFLRYCSPGRSLQRKDMDMTMTLQGVADLFVPVPNFPKEGILFWNVGDLTKHAAAYDFITDELYNRCIAWEKATGKKIDYIGGFDARGFIFGGVVAKMLKVGFLQIRKKGKLPPPVVSIEYETEYSTATQEMNESDLTGKVVVLIDDLLATGGTGEAGCKLVEMLGGEVGFFMAVTDLPALLGRKRLMQYEVVTLLTDIDGKLVAGVRYCVDPLLTDTMSQDLVLIERLSIPLGLAMPGGGIEIGESPVAALIREVQEETDCSVNPADVEFHSILTGADRDPRGPQVSLVLRCKADASDARGEPGKTAIFKMKKWKQGLPPSEDFAFDDHAQTVSELVT